MTTFTRSTVSVPATRGRPFWFDLEMESVGSSASAGTGSWVDSELRSDACTQGALADNPDTSDTTQDGAAPEQDLLVGSSPTADQEASTESASTEGASDSPLDASAEHNLPAARTQGRVIYISNIEAPPDSEASNTGAATTSAEARAPLSAGGSQTLGSVATRGHIGLEPPPGNVTSARTLAPARNNAAARSQNTAAYNAVAEDVYSAGRAAPAPTASYYLLQDAPSYQLRGLAVVRVAGTAVLPAGQSISITITGSVVPVQPSAAALPF